MRVLKFGTLITRAPLPCMSQEGKCIADRKDAGSSSFTTLHTVRDRYGTIDSDAFRHWQLNQMVLHNVRLSRSKILTATVESDGEVQLPFLFIHCL